MGAEISPTPNGPLHAERITALKNDRGDTIDSGDSLYLSLLYKLQGKLVGEYFTATEIVVEKEGPLHVHRIKLNGDARPATEDHYTLCRCGASANKPFCDGMHSKTGFRG